MYENDFYSRFYDLLKYDRSFADKNIRKSRMWTFYARIFMYYERFLIDFREDDEEKKELIDFLDGNGFKVFKREPGLLSMKSVEVVRE